MLTGGVLGILGGWKLGYGAARERFPLGSSALAVEADEQRKRAQRAEEVIRLAKTELGKISSV